MKILTVVGARPQFIKAATISRAIREWNEAGPRTNIEEALVHTGQHYDENMSQTFFTQLSIPEPRYNLDISGGGHGQMTGRMLTELERTILHEKPDWVVVYGDTNSTLAGALAAVKLHVPVAHVEAGLRSYNMRMPEEVNRIVADRVSTLLLCPTAQAVQNLQSEGSTRGVHNVGCVMYDATLFYGEAADRGSNALARFGLEPGAYALATCHRAENTDDAARLRGIAEGLGALTASMPVLLPLHPRTRRLARENGVEFAKGVTVCEPLPFLDIVRLERSARLILTDSGGMQKEAYFCGVPCVTMRDETEWTETVEVGWNVLAGADREKIERAARDFMGAQLSDRPRFYGDGRAAWKILEHLTGAV